MNEDERAELEEIEQCERNSSARIHLALLLEALKDGVRQALVESEFKLSDGYAFYARGGSAGVPGVLNEVAELALTIAAGRVDKLIHPDKFVVDGQEDPIDRVLDTVRDAMYRRTTFQRRVESFMRAGHRERIAVQMAKDLENDCD